MAFRGQVTAWTFLNIMSPQDSRSKDHRIRVRSHITKLQHSRNRVTQCQLYSANEALEPCSDMPDQECKQRSPKSCRERNDVSVTTQESRIAQVRPESDHGRNDRGQTPGLTQKKRRVQCKSQGMNVSYVLPTISDCHGTKTCGVACMRPGADLALTDYGSRAPVQYKSWFGWLTDYWHHKTVPDNRHLLRASLEDVQCYTAFSRLQEHAEPALYYMSLLLASGIPTANKQFSITKALWLRAATLRAINDALAHDLRRTSTPLILAVGQLALHEHIYGDRETAHRLHRTAQQRMIALRGGFKCLDLPLVVMRVMLWYDRLMAAEAGTQALFTDITKVYCVESFSDEEAIEVINISSPCRHQHPGYGPWMSEFAFLQR